MMQHHKYSLTELDNMIPFEREIYLGLLEQHIRDENDRIEKENQKNRTQYYLSTQPHPLEFQYLHHTFLLGQ